MKDTNTHDIAPLSKEFGDTASRVLTVDVDKYQAYLDETDMGDAEREAFLRSLWDIILNFVDLGFGVHPLQEVSEPEATEDSEQQETAGDVPATPPSGLEVK